jgi:hypothetical protein
LSDERKPKTIIVHDAKKGSVKVGIDKRLLTRIPVDVAVKLKSKGSVFNGVMRDFSSGGGRIDSNGDLSLDQIVEVRTAEDDQLIATGQIVRKQDKDLGIKWIQLEDASVKGLLAKKKF